MPNRLPSVVLGADPISAKVGVATIVGVTSAVGAGAAAVGAGAAVVGAGAAAVGAGVAAFSLFLVGLS